MPASVTPPTRATSDVTVTNLPNDEIPRYRTRIVAEPRETSTPAAYPMTRTAPPRMAVALSAVEDGGESDTLPASGGFASPLLMRMTLGVSVALGRGPDRPHTSVWSSRPDAASSL